MLKQFIWHFPTETRLTQSCLPIFFCLSVGHGPLRPNTMKSTHSLSLALIKPSITSCLTAGPVRGRRLEHAAGGKLPRRVFFSFSFFFCFCCHHLKQKPKTNLRCVPLRSAAGSSALQPRIKSGWRGLYLSLPS